MTADGVRIEASSLGPMTLMGTGGQGVVYAVPKLTMRYAEALVYKEYKTTVLAGLDVSVLEEMPSYLERMPFGDAMELLYRAAWPCRLVEDAGEVRGFVMPKIPARFSFDMQVASGSRPTPGEFQHLLNPPAFLGRRHIPLSERHRYDLLHEVARSLSLFHSHDVAVGDLSPKNLLFSLGPSIGVYFIDCDAMRFHGRSALPQIETPAWAVHDRNPSEELGTTASDSYKLALLALRLLVGDQTTVDPKTLAKSVPGEVRQLVRAGLSVDPGSRPAPTDWTAALTAAAASASNAPIASAALPPPPPLLMSMPVPQSTPVMPGVPVPQSAPPPGRRGWIPPQGLVQLPHQYPAPYPGHYPVPGVPQYPPPNLAVGPPRRERAVVRAGRKLYRWWRGFKVCVGAWLVLASVVFAFGGDLRSAGTNGTPGHPLKAAQYAVAIGVGLIGLLLIIRNLLYLRRHR